MRSDHVHISAASVNQTVGDWEGNTERIGRAIELATARGAKVLVLPEMSITGYSLGDRVLRPGTLERSFAALGQIAEMARDLFVVVGLPIRFEGVLYNAMAAVGSGVVHGITCKENLATGDVEYESRWYQAWPSGRVEEMVGPLGESVPIGNLIFDLGGSAMLAVEICEDGWLGFRPGSRYAVAGAEIIANPSASWFMVGKHAVRRRMVEQISLEDHCVYAYTSLLGCDATRLIFDGSVFIASEGGIVEEGRRFVFDGDMELVDSVVDLRDLRNKRLESGSWRQQVLDFYHGEHGPAPHRVEVKGDFSAPTGAAQAHPPYWVAPRETSADVSLEHFVDSGRLPPFDRDDIPHIELELALAMALRDYMAKTGLGGYCLALSGGRDSAMVALLVHRMFRLANPALGPGELRALIASKFVCAYMATENSSDATRNAARAVADECGATFYDGEIDRTVAEVRAVGESMLGRELSWDVPREDLALQNLQARARSVLIWLIANTHGFVLLATSNKSEASVGYTTMDGDTSGGLSPIADVPKSLVQLWLEWATKYHGLTSLEQVLAKAASAELRPQEDEQTDEDDLMPFEVLDQLMYHFVQRSLDPREIFIALWPVFADRYYAGKPRDFADHVARFVRMLCHAQWKRERFAISFRVTAFDLDPKGGYRFPPVQDAFVAEIADLYAYIDALERGDG